MYTQVVDLVHVEARAPALHRMDGDSLQRLIYSWLPRPPRADFTTAASDGATSTAARSRTPLQHSSNDANVSGQPFKGERPERTAIPPAVMLPSVMSIAVRVRGGRATASVLKTIELKYDAGEGLFGTLTRHTRRDPGPGSDLSRGARDGGMLSRTWFCFKMHRAVIETQKHLPATVSKATALLLRRAGHVRQDRTNKPLISKATFSLPNVRARGSIRQCSDSGSGSVADVVPLNESGDSAIGLAASEVSAVVEVGLNLA
jgi:hypothetical protein